MEPRKEKEAGKMLDGREKKQVTVFLLVKVVSKWREVLVMYMRKVDDKSQSPPRLTCNMIPCSRAVMYLSLHTPFKK